MTLGRASAIPRTIQKARAVSAERKIASSRPCDEGQEEGPSHRARKERPHLPSPPSCASQRLGSRDEKTQIQDQAQDAKLGERTKVCVMNGLPAWLEPIDLQIDPWRREEQLVRRRSEATITEAEPRTLLDRRPGSAPKVGSAGSGTGSLIRRIERLLDAPGQRRRVADRQGPPSRMRPRAARSPCCVASGRGCGPERLRAGPGARQGRQGRRGRPTSGSMR